ncbi:Nif3-like dinuclear metal center hexameric protein [Paenibacillus sp. Z3-2]
MDFTVQDIVLHLTDNIELPENTVDQLITGSLAQRVTGIIIAFMPTQHVIEQAIKHGANLIIAHESPFYNHHSHTDWLASDPVYVHKRKMIDEASISIYRCHDIIHRFQPDGITEGLIKALRWSPYVEQRLPEADILSLPEGQTVQAVAQHVKSSLGIDYVRVAGDVKTVCQRVGVLVGFRGNGHVTIPLIKHNQLDLIIAGEGFEWETPEYIRDAVQQGQSKALIMMGHAESEASGMKLLSDRLAAHFPELTVRFAGEKPVYTVI